MKRIWVLLGGGVSVLILAGIVVALAMILQGLREQPRIESRMFQSPIETPTPPSRPQVTPSLVPTATPIPKSTPLPPISWNPTPRCENEPQPLSFWQDYVLKGKDNYYIAEELSSYWRQVQAMSPSLRHIGIDDLATLLETADTAEPGMVLRRELAVLWLNVISGRLNRATSIYYPETPQIKTVSDVIGIFDKTIDEDDISVHLLDISKSLQSGMGIKKSVCARLMVLQFGNVIKEVTWENNNMTEAKLVEQIQESTFPWIMSRLIPSPNRQLVAIETVGYERGGPVYLWDRKTGDWLNLNGTAEPITMIRDIALSEEDRDWYVIGWLPDSSQLIVGSTFSQGMFRIDIKRKTYSVIEIPEKHIVIERKTVSVSPEGTKLAYIIRNTMTNVEELRLFDLSTKQFATIDRIQDSSGNIVYPQFSPSGNYLLYVFREKYPSTKQAIIAVDLATNKKTFLFSGYLADSKPVWSPDDQTVAFVRGQSEIRYISVPSVGRIPVGDLWTVSISTKQLTRGTSIGGLILHPIWSPSSEYLAFVAHGGGIGMYSLGNQKDIWKVTSYPPRWPLFTSIYFEP